MQGKYVWMALSIAAIWFAVLFIGLYGPTIVVEGAGAEYGLDVETHSLAAPVGYFAAITTLFMLLPATKRKKESTGVRKKYVSVTLSIVAIWFVVLLVGSSGFAYEVREADPELNIPAETWPVAIPVTFFAAISTVFLAIFVANFGLGTAEEPYGTTDSSFRIADLDSKLFE